MMHSAEEAEVGGEFFSSAVLTATPQMHTGLMF